MYMKKAIIIWLLFFPLIIEAQDYLNSTCTWKEFFNEGFLGIVTEEYYDISLAGDTTINNTTYHKVLKTGTRKTRNIFLDSIIEYRSISELLSPIREENGVFYYLKTFSNIEHVLHDFNLEIGDTIKSNCSTPQIVEQIDTVWVGNIARKRFKIRANGQFFLIEGVGSTQGLFQPTCMQNIHIGRRLRCYGFEDQFIEFDTLAECNTIVSTEIVNLSNFKIDIYPNPFNDQISIDWIYPIQDAELRILDALGRLVYQNRQLTSPSTIDTRHWTPGVYFYQLLEKGEIVKTGKLLKS